jgi:hypothetical protein
MKRVLVVLALMMAGALFANAQTAIYGAVSASNLNDANVGWKYGDTFGLYYDHWGVPFVRAGIDVRASFIGSGATKMDSGLIGPRIQLHPHVLPLMPYAEALVGGAHVKVGEGIAYTDKSSPEWALDGGLDMTVFPRLDWRVVDYSWGRVINTGFRPQTLSTGLVLRLP